MFANYLSAALRNLIRNKAVAAINILGLAIGFAAAILIGLYVRYELSYDTFIPGHERVYRLSVDESFSSGKTTVWDSADHGIAEHLKTTFPDIERSARLTDNWLSIRHGGREFHEQVYTADPDFFRIIQVKTVAGDLASALDAPDGFVISRSMARKYFGKDAPVGETLEINRGVVVRVTAVIEDLPGNSHFNFAMIGSGRAGYSSLAYYDKLEERPPFMWGARTYFRLREGASIASVERELPQLVERLYPPFLTSKIELVLHPIQAVHLAPAGRWPIKPAGSPQTLVALSVVAALIVLIAVINFVNLMTARAAERSVEIGVRKVTGARRRDLIVQFASESLLYVFASMVLAIALVELMLPALNAILDPGEEIYAASTITFPYWSSPALAATIAAATLLIGLAAAAYPAFVMSSFRPAVALKRDTSFGGSAWIRHTLVIAQFAILVGLIFATAVIHRQTAYAMDEALRIDADQVLLIHTYGANEALKNGLAELPGVLDVTSSRAAPTNYDISAQSFQKKDGTPVQLQMTAVDYDFLEFYGLEPTAGRGFSRDYGTDLARHANAHWSVVLNETAARALGYTRAEDAVGEPLLSGRADESGPAGITIVGAVPDFPVSSVRQPIQPAVFLVDPEAQGIVSVRLSGQDIPETLEQIDALWARVGEPRAISRWFLDQYYARMYRDMLQQRKLLGSLCVIAVLLACLGLFGLSIFMAQRRTKEIGVRKALGAKSSDVLALLLWSFSKPVLWASVLAWPAAMLIMQRWLNGFAYRVDLGWWLLPLASLLALAIALLTVSVHSYLVARSKPVEALRYE